MDAKDLQAFEYDEQSYTYIDNSFGYTMGTMSILFDKKIGLSQYLPGDIIDIILDFVFYPCYVCNGFVVVQGTVCSKLCILASTFEQLKYDA